MTVDAPSSAVLVLALPPSQAFHCLSQALTAERYQAFDRPLPQGYRASEVEFLAWRFEALPPFGRESISNTAIVSAQPGRIFHVALALTKHVPELCFSAWRHLQGGTPVLKLYWGGRPRWREGDDHDHELEWELPAELPAADVSPPFAFPNTLKQLNPLLYGLAPFRRFSAAPNERAFIARSSPLA